MKFLILVLYFDDASEACAVKWFGDQDGFRLTKIESTKVLENVAYQTFADVENDDFDFLGTISYRAPEKGLTADGVRRRLAVAETTRATQKIDVVAFQTPAPRGGLLAVARHYHGDVFVKVWHLVLSRLGYTDHDILTDDVRPYYCNYWVCSPKFMKRFLTFQKRVFDVMEHSDISTLLSSDSHYEGKMSTERRKSVFGHSYYTLHPFVLERLSCFFFQREGASILYL